MLTLGQYNLTQSPVSNKGWLSHVIYCTESEKHLNGICVLEVQFLASAYGFRTIMKLKIFRWTTINWGPFVYIYVCHSSRHPLWVIALEDKGGLCMNFFFFKAEGTWLSFMLTKYTHSYIKYNWNCQKKMTKNV